MSSPFPFIPQQSALLVVDMQRYFTEPHFPFCRLSGARVEGGIAGYFRRLDTVVVPHLQSLLRTFRKRAGPVIYTRLGSYTTDGSDLPAWARRINEAGLAAFGSPVFPNFDHPSAEIDPRVAPEAGEDVVRKTTTGAIASFPLDSDLRASGITSVVIAGVLTPFCVAQTARELADRNFDVAIAEEATASLTEAAHSAALAAFSAIYGWVVSTAEILKALER